MKLTLRDVVQVESDAKTFIELLRFLPPACWWAINADGRLVAVCEHRDGHPREITAAVLRQLVAPQLPGKRVGT